MKIFVQRDQDGHGLMWLDNDTDLEGSFAVVPFDRGLIKELLDLTRRIVAYHLINTSYGKRSGVTMSVDEAGGWFALEGEPHEVMAVLRYAGAEDTERMAVKHG